MLLDGICFVTQIRGQHCIHVLSLGGQFPFYE